MLLLEAQDVTVAAHVHGRASDSGRQIAMPALYYSNSLNNSSTGVAANP